MEMGSNVLLLSGQQDMVFFFFFLGDWVQLWFLRVRDLDGFN